MPVELILDLPDALREIAEEWAGRKPLHQLEEFVTQRRFPRLAPLDRADSRRVWLALLMEARIVRMRQARESLGLTQAQLGVELQKSQSTIHMYEAGVRHVPRTVILSLEALEARNTDARLLR